MCNIVNVVRPRLLLDMLHRYGGSSDPSQLQQVEAWFSSPLHSITMLLTALLGLVSGVGLLRLRNWARLTVFAYVGISLLMLVANVTLYRHPVGSFAMGAGLWFFLLLWSWKAFIVVYLLRPSVKAQFHRQR